MSSGQWAIVTGASSGIGRALALEFAHGGYNVVLTGRNVKALEDTAKECSKRFHVETSVMTADLAQLDEVSRLVRELQAAPRDYAALVNNAGFGIHGDFASTNVEDEIAMLHVQLAATLKLTKAVLPGMRARRVGKILNVASVYAFGPVPSQSVYAACKAFLLSFSASLQDELRDTGIQVTVFCPGVTQTAFRSRAGITEKSSKSGISAEAAARIGYTAMKEGRHIVVPGLPNRVFRTLAGILPFGTFAALARWINQRRGVNPH